VATRDLREWIALLEREGELARISAEVDPHLEMTEIVDRVVRAGGPALLFERPKGLSASAADQPVRTERRMCLGVRRREARDIGSRLADVLEMQPPEGLVAKVRGLKTLKSIADSRPESSSGARCRRSCCAATTSTSACCPSRPAGRATPGPFITLPAVITHDPRTGTRNVGMYRLQVLGPRSTAMHWQIHKDGRADYLFSEGRLEVAVALGLDPITAYTASAPLPKHIDEFMLAGFLRDSAVELVKGVSIDVEVPAHAEIVLEGYVEQGDLTEEGPFGDHTGYYTPPSSSRSST
jgi:3-polyprenyl-4-hydroxybenzoate decarboxylase and related decarboxylases